jgi:hypothetical protein
MPFRKFGKYDIIYNQVKTFPESDFIIYDSKVYYNNFKNSDDRAAKNGNLLAVPQGFISLFELNVDRPIGDGGLALPPTDATSIYPFITKDGARTAFKTISTSEFDSTSQFQFGDVIKSKYPLSSSIKRTRFEGGVSSIKERNDDERFHGSYNRVVRNKKFIVALKNTFNEYVKHSHHYAFDDTTNPRSSMSQDQGNCGWNKSTQELSLVEIPSIFYGSSIDKGSVILQIFMTGALAAEARDIKKNGELIQVSGTYNAKKHNNKVVGTVLYNEGFIALTGSWDVSQATETFHAQAGQEPRWVDFAEGANETGGPARGTLDGAMFRMRFKGVNFIPTVTMMAHMPKGELNNSTNPTVYKDSQVKTPVTSSTRYEEFDNLLFENLQHSPYVDPTGSFNKQTYVSKVGIYDDQKRLIAVAKLANPIRKTENRDYTFKLKMDF